MECEPLCISLILALICPLIAGAPSLTSCPKENLGITEGSFVLSNGYSDRSVLTYKCLEGFYPTVKTRHCRHGNWDPKPTKKSECKKITCPNPRVMENGEVKPIKENYYVNDTTTYSCHSDYTFRGSAVRVCQANGKWSGRTPICALGSDHCPDPGIPPGSSRSGHMFDIGDKVTYNCDSGLTLVGSKERECQDGGEWSGTEPQCYAPFTYDTPGEAAEAFGSSLKTNLAISEQLEGIDQKGKQIHVDQGGKLDIYIAMDVSDSIDPDDFEIIKDITKKLIEKISYYQVSPNYEILMFAKNVLPKIVSMRQFKIPGGDRNLTKVLETLKDFKYESKGDESGTNIANAYSEIYESMRIEKDKDKDFLQTQHVVIMFTDGIANMGGEPEPIVQQIKDLVKEDKLDLYVFGVGDVNVEDMNGLVSNRGNEKFFFKLQDLEHLQKTFDSMIDEGTSVGLCGLHRDYDEGRSTRRRRYPWLAKITVTHKQGKPSNCMGSLVTSNFVLTAAHCFRFGDRSDGIKVVLKPDSEALTVKKVISHPDFNIEAKRHMGIKEYYEYDVALIELEDAVTMDLDVRPICLPCTKETNGALKLSDSEGTCKRHEQILLRSETTPAGFMSEIKDISRMENIIIQKNITIKQGDLRKACVEDATKAKVIDAKNPYDVVNENFLCSGGTEVQKEHVACKGDSGGATFVVNGVRAVQVGVVSWGVKDLCKEKNVFVSEEHTRDYHTNLFSKEMRIFLQDYLGDGNLGTPLTFLDINS